MSGSRRRTDWGRRLRAGRRYADTVRSVRSMWSPRMERFTRGYAAAVLAGLAGLPLGQAIGELLKICFSAASPVIGAESTGRLLLAIACASAVFWGATLGPVQAVTAASRFRLTLPVPRERLLAGSLALCTSAAVIAALAGGALTLASGSLTADDPALMIVEWALLAAVLVGLAAAAQALRGWGLTALCAGLAVLVSTGLLGHAVFGGASPWTRLVTLALLLAVEGCVLRRIRTETVLDASRRSVLAYASLHTGDAGVSQAALTLTPRGFRPHRRAGRSGWWRVLIGLARTAPAVIAGLFVIAASALLLPTLTQGTWPQVVFGLLVFLGMGPLFGPARQEAVLQAQGVLRRRGFWTGPHLAVGAGLTLAAMAPGLLLLPPSPALWATASVCLLVRLRELAAPHLHGPPEGAGLRGTLAPAAPMTGVVMPLVLTVALLWGAQRLLLIVGG